MPLPTLTALRERGEGRPARAPSVPAQAVAAYRRAPQSQTLIVLALLVAVACAAASSLHYPPWPVAAATASTLALAHIAVHRPGATLTCLLLAVYASLSPLVASAYLSAMGGADFAILLNLCVAALIAALVAHRTSIGRAPVTVALTLVALGVAGPLLTLALPALGAANGYALVAAVLYARSRTWALPARLRAAPRDVTADSAARLTATVIAALPPAFTILTDVAVGRTGARAPHLVIGPTGVHVLVSMAQPGIVREHPTRGLELDGVALAPTLSPVLDLARAVATVLDLHAEDVTPTLVMHGPRLPNPHTVIALVAATGDDTGHVHVVAAPHLLTVLNPDTTDPATLTDPGTVTALVKRARKGRGRRADASMPDSADTDRSVTVLDASGRPKAFTDPGDPAPMFRSTSVDSTVLVGQRVSLITDQGTFPGYRVVSAPRAEEDGTIVASVCTEREWDRARTEGRETTSFPYPLASLTAT